MSFGNFSHYWPTNHSRALEHYSHQAALARATRELEASRQIERLAVAEARRQRERADALARRVEDLTIALRAP